MGIPAPYRRTVRQLLDGSYAHSGNGEYIQHARYATNAKHFARSFAVIDEEVHSFLEYVEPADTNLPTFSLKLHGLLMRLCIEIEANLRAILKDNRYVPPNKWSMTDYRKVEESHFLSLYSAQMPVWSGTRHTYEPFSAWKQGGPLPWYQAYNEAKHDRQGSFEKASFENVIAAYCALSIVLFSQFRNESFSGPDYLVVSDTAGDGFDYGPSHNILIKAPQLTVEERYEFDWRTLRTEEDPFRDFQYR